MRSGIDRITGQRLTGWAHCRQSIATILSTRIGSLVMARDFGSSLPGLVDRPGNALTVAAFYMGVVTALKKEEPGFAPTKVNLQSMDGKGRATLQIEGTFYPDALVNDFTATIPISEVVEVTPELLATLKARGNA